MNTHLMRIPMLDPEHQHQPLQDKLQAAIQEVVRSGHYVLGQAVAEFEIAFATACGVDYGVGVGTETDAITLALQGCGIGRGDEVLLPAHLPISTLLGVVRSQATPILVDCHLDTGLMDMVAAEKRITPKTRAILPVHLYGQMVPPLPLLDMAGTYDLMIVEDASHAPFAERDGYRAGSVGTAAAFSFHPSRNLSALGDAAMVVTREGIVAQTVRSLRNCGATRKHYHTDIGTQSRLDTLQAAVLSVKFPHLAAWTSDRFHLAQHYDRLLAPLADQGILPLTNDCGAGHVYHLYVVRITDDCPLDRATLQMELAAQGIQTAAHYPVPQYLQPAFKGLGYVPSSFPRTEQLSQEVLSLPLYPGLGEPQAQQVVDAIAALTRFSCAIELGS
jgi:dTDP-4-amino-4,6-dideoxygalactose transaminase